MKKLLGILVLGLGIVLSIPNSTFAVNSCDFNTVDGNAITGDLTAQHICVAGDVMDITTGSIITSGAQPIKSKNNIFTLTIESGGTVETTGGSIAILAQGDDQTIINNGGTIRVSDPSSTNGIKAQGATFNEIFIDYSNILKCKQVTIRNRLMYVALTRAKTNVYISQ